MPGMIYTFYSYKGGVGRSMALANIGMYFYLQGYTTLLVDWDLEAPGLERYFEKRFNLNVSDIIERPGIIDLIKDYKELSLQPLASEKVDEEQLFPDLDKYLFALDQAPKKKLFLLHAGRRSPGRPWSDYTSFVQAFDWANFYDEWEGGAFIDWLQEQFKQKADIILIDSRTGVTEVGGVATQHLADVVLLICGSNLENIESTARMARNFASEQVKEARNGRPLDIIVVPSRIDNSDTDGYGEFLKRIEKTVTELPVAKPETGHKLAETIIPYFPAFSYRETLIFGDKEAERIADQLAESYLHIAENMQILSLSKRYERSKTQGKRAVIFLNYSVRDKVDASQISLALQAAGYQVWFDQSEIKGGQTWTSAIVEGINRSDLIVSIISENANESSWVQKELLYALDQQKTIIPVRIDASPLPLILINHQYISCESDLEAGIQQLIAVLPRQIEALAEREVLSDARQIELDYLDKLLLEYGSGNEVYVPIAGVAKVQDKPSKPEILPTSIEAQFRERLRSYSDKKAPDILRKYDDISQAVEDIRQLVILGEPGSGKTTLLWKIASVYAVQAKDTPAAPIPVFIRLGELTGERNITQLINVQLGRLASSYSELLAKKRLIFLLDGLNEIPINQRDKALKQINALVRRCMENDIMITITSRQLDYHASPIDIPNTVLIAPMDTLRIYRFIQTYITNPPNASDALFWALAGSQAQKKWDYFSKTQDVDIATFWTSDSLSQKDVDEKTQQRWNEWISVRDTAQGWLPLSANPYMLLMITQVYQQQRHLPQNRGKLFELFTDFLLENRERLSNEDSEDIKEKLADLAHAITMQYSTMASRDTALMCLKDETTLYKALSASILSGSTEIRFSHQLFQEYFAARRLAQDLTKGTPATRFFPVDNWWEPTGWEEMAILLAGLYSDDCTPVLEWLSDAQPELTARCVRESGAITPTKTLEYLSKQWLPRLTDLSRDSNPNARAAIGRALGLLSLDNRKGVGCLVKDGTELPDIGWCEIPSGQFLMGSDPTRTPEALDHEKPQQVVELPTYYISRYPITCAQYQSFIADGGYQNKSYWISSGWKWKTQEEVSSPLYSDDSNWHISNHPIVGISWYEAYAFTRWLSEKFGVEVRLPTEPEWEKAARGTDERNYPWGDSFSEDYANIRIEKLGYGIMRTSPVGIFPQGASPFGALDMCGNVLEWCLNEYIMKYPYKESLDINSDKQRPARGGSWSTDNILARLAARSGFLPHSRFNYLGFRVVTLSPI